MKSTRMDRLADKTNTSNTKLDHLIFDDYKAASEGLPETYEILSRADPNEKLNAQSKWLNGQNVDLSAYNIDDFHIVEHYEEMLKFKRRIVCSINTLNNLKAGDNVHDISRLDKQLDILNLYRWKVNEALANYQMIETSASKSLSPEVKRSHFRHWNEFVYGSPKPEIYGAAVDWIATDAENIIDNKDSSSRLVGFAGDVLSILDSKRGDRKLIIPTSDLFNAAKQDQFSNTGYYSSLMRGTTVPDDEIDIAKAQPIIRRVLKNIGSDYKLGDADGNSWSVSHLDEEVRAPKEINMSRERFIGLVCGHEIGCHILEKINGEQSDLELLAEGTDRNEFSEGRAVIREMLVYDTFEEFGKILRWRDILRRHIAISYAAGVGLGLEYGAPSAAVYRFINKIDLMYAYYENNDNPEAFAHKRTTDLLVRVLRGTDGEGGAYYKDKVYLEGSAACWKKIKKYGPKVISEGDLGKFDVTNERVIEKLVDIGISAPSGDELV